MNIEFSDRESFLAKYNAIVHKCKGSRKVIWKESFCDGKSDCYHNEDEENCNGKCKLFSITQLIEKYNDIINDVWQHSYRMT